MNGRIAQASELEGLFRRALIVSRCELPGARQGVNVQPQLVRVFDPLAQTTTEAVARAATAQPAQGVFAWKVAKAIGAEDVVAVSGIRDGRRGGSLVELVDGHHPATLADISQHLDTVLESSDGAWTGRSMTHALVGHASILGNADYHSGQVRLTRDGVRGFDFGHMGREHRLGLPAELTPVTDELMAAAGLRGPRWIVETAELDGSAVERLTARGDSAITDIVRAHEELATWRGPLNQRMRSTTRFVQSQQYLDGVIARFERLRRDGVIAYVDRRATKPYA